MSDYPAWLSPRQPPETVGRQVKLLEPLIEPKPIAMNALNAARFEKKLAELGRTREEHYRERRRLQSKRRRAKERARKAAATRKVRAVDKRRAEREAFWREA